MVIYDYVNKNKIKTPVKLEIGLDKIVRDRNRQGNEMEPMKPALHICN